RACPRGERGRLCSLHPGTGECDDASDGRDVHRAGRCGPGGERRNDASDRNSNSCSGNRERQGTSAYFGSTRGKPGNRNGRNWQYDATKRSTRCERPTGDEAPQHHSACKTGNVAGSNRRYIRPVNDRNASASGKRGYYEYEAGSQASDDHTYEETSEAGARSE